MKKNLCLIILAGLITLTGCASNSANKASRIPVILDTDTNNELDDQHALAYLLFNGKTFTVEGVTVNATSNGGAIEGHYAEAQRVIQLCNLEGKIPILRGANSSFNDLAGLTSQRTFDGCEAVDFIITTAQKYDADRPLVIIAVGKLTNLALALKKEPAIAHSIRIVWLGSNYPEPGEYNQDNDIAAMNYVLQTRAPFEMVTVRYGKPSGTDAVRATQTDISRIMPGKGPRVKPAVMGRHGAAFDNFGDYSVNLFAHIDYHGTPPSRALFDMAAVAIVKNPAWAQSSAIPCPALINNRWVNQPDNSRRITVWENFVQDKIISDFYRTMERYTLVRPAPSVK